MAKYSTGKDWSEESVEKVKEHTQTDDESDSRKKRAAQKQAEVYDAATGDSTHWEEEGTNYEADQLPHLVSDYNERVGSARKAAELSIEELAQRLELNPADIEAVEEANALQADVGGSVVHALEDEFDIEIIDT